MFFDIHSISFWYSFDVHLDYFVVEEFFILTLRDLFARSPNLIITLYGHFGTSDYSLMFIDILWYSFDIHVDYLFVMNGLVIWEFWHSELIRSITKCSNCSLWILLFFWLFFDILLIFIWTNWLVMIDFGYLTFWIVFGYLMIWLLVLTKNFIHLVFFEICNGLISWNILWFGIKANNAGW